MEKNIIQGDEDTFDELIKDLKKSSESLVLHMTGSQSARKRFEAMLG